MRNLATTRKNARVPKRAKPGRKRPRPGNIEKKFQKVDQSIYHISEGDSDSEAELSPIKGDPDMTLNKKKLWTLAHKLRYKNKKKHTSIMKRMKKKKSISKEPIF